MKITTFKSSVLFVLDSKIYVNDHRDHVDLFEVKNHNSVFPPESVLYFGWKNEGKQRSNILYDSLSFPYSTLFIADESSIK